jgi:hypothetical protein
MKYKHLALEECRKNLYKLVGLTDVTPHNNKYLFLTPKTVSDLIKSKIISKCTSSSGQIHRLYSD